MLGQRWSRIATSAADWLPLPAFDPLRIFVFPFITRELLSDTKVYEP
jgi:hypothetical protein